MTVLGIAVISPSGIDHRPGSLATLKGGVGASMKGGADKRRDAVRRGLHVGHGLASMKGDVV